VSDLHVSILRERGVSAGLSRAANYSSLQRDEYFKKANESLLIIQLEGKEVLDDLDNILKVEGVDIFFIGPYDLSQSLGARTGDPSKVIETVNSIVKRLLNWVLWLEVLLIRLKQLQWKRRNSIYLVFT